MTISKSIQSVEMRRKFHNSKEDENKKHRHTQNFYLCTENNKKKIVSFCALIFTKKHLPDEDIFAYANE